MEKALIEVGVAVTASLVLMFMVWAAKKSDMVQAWWHRQMRAADAADELLESERVETLREQVSERARQLGVNLPRSRSGNRVTYVNGEVVTFIEDFNRYRSAMQSRQVDPFRTRTGTPPTPLSHRGRVWLEEWLAEHPLP